MARSRDIFAKLVEVIGGIVPTSQGIAGDRFVYDEKDEGPQPNRAFFFRGGQLEPSDTFTPLHLGLAIQLVVTYADDPTASQTSIEDGEDIIVAMYAFHTRFATNEVELKDLGDWLPGPSSRPGSFERTLDMVFGYSLGV